jgi:hypothetical protein
MTMWQPIETAPKDQTFLAVLNCAGHQTICTMRWAVAEEKNSRPDHDVFHVERVTHWMPLPDLPGAQPTPSVPDEEAAYSEWFHGEQGVAYDGMWAFAKAAWMARAALNAAPKPEE